MRLSIRTKFLLLVSLLLLAIFSVITVSLIQNGTSSLRKDLLDESKAFASLATQPIGNTFAIYMDSGTSKIDIEVNKYTDLNSNITNILVVDIAGKVAYAQSEDSLPVVNAEEASSFEPIFRNNQNGALETIIFPYFEASGAHRFSVVYVVSDDGIEAAVRQEAMSLLYFGLASLVITMALTYLLINRLIIRPIKQVSEQAGVISAGNLEQQIKVRGGDEIASLGDSVNRMAESLKADIAKLKEVDKVKSEFMLITSHNLRTPLTIINGYLENMNMFNDAESLKNALTKIGASVKRLDIFAEDILTISQFELGDEALRPEDTLINEFLTKIIDEFTPTAALKELEFNTELPAVNTKVRISRPHMRSAVWNILDNAVKFTPQGGKVSLRMTLSGRQVEIQIADSGIGISPAEIPKLFTKFHRGTSTLAYDFEGTGIGLYSSKVIVERHGGTIRAESQEGKGSTFTITLPIADTAQTQ